jgi:hypothetical protein
MAALRSTPRSSASQRFAPLSFANCRAESWLLGGRPGSGWPRKCRFSGKTSLITTSARGADLAISLGHAFPRRSMLAASDTRSLFNDAVFRAGDSRQGSAGSRVVCSKRDHIEEVPSECLRHAVMALRDCDEMFKRARA